jgi:cardiolipin synthase
MNRSFATLLPESSPLLARRSAASRHGEGAFVASCVPTIAAHGHELVRRLSEPVLGGNRADLFRDDAAAHDGLLAAVAQAREHINLDASLLHAPSVRAALIDRLEQARRAGTKVNIRTSARDSAWLGGDLSRLEAAGVTLSGGGTGAALWPGRPEPAAGALRQLAVMDGRVAWVGPGAPERDHGAQGLYVQVQGPVVQHLQRLFLDSWKASSPRAPLPNDRYFPAIPLSGRQRMGVALRGASEREKGRPGHALLGAIGIAREKVAVTLTSAIASSALAHALTAAAARGVEVAVLLPPGDALPLLWRARMEEWQRAGVRVHQCGQRDLRAFICVVDYVLSSIVLDGGSNPLARPARGGVELLILDADAAHRMSEVYASLLEDATPVGEGAWLASLGWLRWVRHASPAR